MNLYATLDQYHAEKEISTAVSSLSNADKMRILNAIERASRRVDAYCHRHFYPLRATQYFDYLDAWEMRFRPHELLEAETVKTGGGDTTVSASDYDLLTGSVYGLYPKSRLLIHTDSGTTLDIGDRYEQANQVTGVWGYHEDYDNAWLSSLDTVEDNPLTAAATSLTVNDADNADARGVIPRFQVGQLLKIEAEYLYVAGVNTTTNVLTVVRARNGTAAASHVQNTAITIFQPMFDVTLAAIVIAGAMRELPKAPHGMIQAQTRQGGTFPVPLSMPKAASELLEPYIRQDIGVKHVQRQSGGGRLYPEGRNPWGGR